MTASSRTLGGYRLVAGLGTGGMARVYLAMAQKAGGFTKLLVLKILRTDLDADGDFLAMFMQEARIAARLNHPNVVQTYEVGEDTGRHLIAMEYLEGQALSSVITRVGRGKLPLDIELRVLCDILEGLHYAHELTDYDGTPLRIVHRDVSPQNIFVTYTGQSKLVDFGIAKVAGTAHTQQGIIKGKVGYLAPEQATGKPVDCRADVYSIGVLLWEALTGRRFVERGEDEVVALTRRVLGTDRRVRDVAPEAPAELAEICDKAMATSPEDRFATAAEMRDAIEAYARKGQPADARRVAALLDEHFAEDRTRIRRLVEEQVKRADQTGPLIELKTGATITPPANDIEIRVDVEPTFVTKRRFPVALIGGAAALLVFGGLAFALATRRVGAARADASPAVAELVTPTVKVEVDAGVTATASAAPSLEALASVAIRTAPPTATLLLDGKRIPNPYQTKLARDGSTHTLQITAPGFSSEQKVLVLDRDHDALFTLVKAPVAGPAPADVDLSGIKPKRPKRTVDDKDPY